MDIGDVGAAILASLPPRSVSVKRKGGRMTTESMEVFSLEEGDTIEHQGALYRVLDFEHDEEGGIRIVCADEEGYRRHIWAASAFDKVKIIVDEA